MLLNAIKLRGMKRVELRLSRTFIPVKWDEIWAARIFIPVLGTGMINVSQDFGARAGGIVF